MENGVLNFQAEVAAVPLPVAVGASTYLREGRRPDLQLCHKPSSSFQTQARCQLNVIGAEI